MTSVDADSIIFVSFVSFCKILVFVSFVIFCAA